MKKLFSLMLLSVLILPLSAQEQPKPVNPDSPASSDIDPATRFLFYSVLEGLYEDGLTNEEVDRILMRNKGQSYFHFIYACPVCGPTIWALEAYRKRPEALYGLKLERSTFGQGLSRELRAQLYSDDSNQRLKAINTLVQGWITRRLAGMNLSEKERSSLLESLAKKRESGMKTLKIFKEEKEEGSSVYRVESLAPAYVNVNECAVCNGAVGKAMKLPEVKAVP